MHVLQKSDDHDRERETLIDTYFVLRKILCNFMYLESFFFLNPSEQTILISILLMKKLGYQEGSKLFKIHVSDVGFEFRHFLKI